MPTIGVLLCGCGVFDGSEIYESTLALLALDRLGYQVLCMAPDAPQLHVIDHLRGIEASETRNILVEASRLTRGKIVDMATVDASDLDGLVVPGGFGAVKNLCDFAVKGLDCFVHPEVTRLVSHVYAAGKPMAFCCITPVLAAKLLGCHGVTLTIGNDPDTASAIEQFGAHHQECPVDDCIVDEAHKIVSTPAYMFDERISNVAKGIDKAIEILSKWVKGA